MAGNFNLEQTNSYTSGMEAKVAGNSVVVDNGVAVTMTGGFIVKTGAGDTIEGVSVTKKTFASDNQTVAQEAVVYHPVSADDHYLMRLAGGTSLVFAGALVADNVINLKVNGVAMTAVTYAASNDNTLDLIATQLETQFPSLIASADRSGTRTVAITVQPGSTVTLSDIVVTLGVGQTTGSQVENFEQADVGDFYDIVATSQFVDGMTNSATSGQVKLEAVASQSYGIFSIANT